MIVISEKLRNMSHASGTLLLDCSEKLIRKNNYDVTTADMMPS